MWVKGAKHGEAQMVHVELCARMAMECGGGTEVVHDPTAMVLDVDRRLSPPMQAAELCVG